GPGLIGGYMVGSAGTFVFHEFLFDRCGNLVHTFDPGIHIQAVSFGSAMIGTYRLGEPRVYLFDQDGNVQLGPKPMPGKLEAVGGDGAVYTMECVVGEGGGPSL